MLLVSYCGLNCEECEAFVATKNNDGPLKEKVAKNWSKLYGIKVEPKDISCAGCKSSEKKDKYCESMCKIRKCCQQKEIETCAHCEAFACEYLQEVFDYSLDAKKTLECLRSTAKLVNGSKS
jgi:flavodoxin